VKSKHIGKIPLCIPDIGPEEFKAVNSVLKSGWLTHGPKTTEFEEIFAEYIGVKHAVAMNSCTSALFLSLIANGIKGDVLVPSFTFVASANAIVTAGLNPVFVDINYHDCNVNPDVLEEYITANTEAIMIVHFAGQCCDMDKINTFVKKHGILLVEDSAETIGGTFKGKMSGSWGTGCFSFFPTKNITTGEGGMLTTNDDEFAHKVRTLIAHGIEKSTLERQRGDYPWHRVATMSGFNFRLSNVLAAVGVEQMKKLDKMNEARRGNSEYLIDKLKHIEEIDLPVRNIDCHHVYQMFTIKLNKGDRDSMVLWLRENGIEASVHFTPPVHHHPAFRKYRDNYLPVTENIAKSILTLPMFPGLTPKELDYISEIIEKYIVNNE